MPATTAPARSDRRKQRTRAALLDAGRRLFSERDPAAVTIQEITDAADVAKGSFYNHFDSREALREAAAAAALEELGSAIDREVEQRESDPARVIARSLLATLRAGIADPALGGFLLKRPDVLELGEAIRTRGERDLRRGQRAGRFSVSDLPIALEAIAGGGQAILRGRLQGSLEESAEASFVALVLCMLGIERGEADAIAAEAARAVGGDA